MNSIKFYLVLTLGVVLSDKYCTAQDTIDADSLGNIKT